MIKKSLLVNNQRESNGELLRLICMMLIVIHHFCVHGIYPETLKLRCDNIDGALSLYFHSVLYVGVNCFILLSGFYGIKARWKGFLLLYLTLAFYGIIYSLKNFIIPGLQTGFSLKSIWGVIIFIVFPISKLPLWYMQCYFGLFLLSPIFNYFRDTADKKLYGYILISLTIVNVYWGCGQHVYFLNDSGYCFSQFIYMYMVGGYLSRFYPMGKMKVNRKKFVWIYLVAMFVWGGLTYLSSYMERNGYGQLRYWHPFFYNELCINT